MNRGFRDLKRKWKEVAITLAFALAISGIMYAIDYATDDTKAQRTLVSNPTLLDLVTRNPIADDTPFYEVEDLTTNVYTRWRSGTGNVFIRRHTITGNIVRVEMAVTTWMARASATYVAAPR